MSTFAPSAGMTRGTRGALARNRSSSERCSWLGAGAASAVPPPSRGKNAIAEPAPAKNNTVSAIAIGLAIQARISDAARRGSVVIGNFTAAPEITYSPMTAAYVIRQSGQRVFKMKKDA